MWKKEDMPGPTTTPQFEPPPRPERPASTNAPAERATIGRSITIRGDVTGDEDLLIQGRVNGSVDLKQHAVTVGAEGEVQASIIGRVVIVEGRVEGNISSDEQIILRSSAWVQGDITAPRVVLEDGARFRGGVDMGDTADRGRTSTNSVSSQVKKPAGISNSAQTSLDTSTEKGKNSSDSVAEKGKNPVDTAAGLTT